MATSLRLVVFLCAAVASRADFVQDVETDFLDEAEALSHYVEKRATNKDQSVIYGKKGSDDRLLYHEFVDISKRFFQVQEKDISYPPKPIFNGPIITCMKVMDNLKTSRNAEVKLINGGVWQKYADINLKSKRCGPIKYNVSIYGREPRDIEITYTKQTLSYKDKQ